jgi:EAL domain-containing protein (putative c-di-GMP-specific phosphodiesterase class I)
MTPIFELLFVGSDPTGLGIGASPQLGEAKLVLTAAKDRASVRQAFARPDRWDLILCRASTFYDLGVDSLLADAGAALHASLILIRAPTSALSPGEAARRGAADVVTHGDREHLEMVMARELANASMRRRLRRLTGKVQGGTGASVEMPTIADFVRPANAPKPIEPRLKAVPTKPAIVQTGRNQDEPSAATDGTYADDARVKSLIEGGGLTLEYQPIVPLRQAGPQAAMFEALLRLRDESGELLPPQRFFPAASRHQWLGRLDLWVCRRALPVLSQMQESNAAQTRLFINLSAETLAMPKVANTLIDTIGAAKVRDGTLTIELRKEALTHETEHLERLRKVLKEHGHGILMEQFGIGDCDLLADHAEWLTHVKLDGALLRGVANHASVRKEVQRTISCARNCGVQVIALAVDNAELLPELYALEVDYIQGHFVSKPYEALIYPDLFNVESHPTEVEGPE